MKRRLSISFLAVLLAISCGRKDNAGTPYILYEIHGEVRDAEGNPLHRIKVRSGSSESVETSVNGVFVVSGKSSPTASAIVDVICEDLDGEANGGSFMKTSQPVQLKLRSAGNGNNKGNYFASGVSVTMIAKNEGLQNGGEGPTPY
jgi:putative lipoprotein (rSAM/lipoprotein system)